MAEGFGDEQKEVREALEDASEDGTKEDKDIIKELEEHCENERVKRELAEAADDDIKVLEDKKRNDEQDHEDVEDEMTKPKGEGNAVTDRPTSDTTECDTSTHGTTLNNTSTSDEEHAKVSKKEATHDTSDEYDKLSDLSDAADQSADQPADAHQPSRRSKGKREQADPENTPPQGAKSSRRSSGKREQTDPENTRPQGAKSSRRSSGKHEQADPEKSPPQGHRTGPGLRPSTSESGSPQDRARVPLSGLQSKGNPQN